jgi:hypothetical protein
VALLEGEQMLDCMEVRFGLRTVSTRKREILLNGEPLKSFVILGAVVDDGWHPWLKGDDRIGIDTILLLLAFVFVLIPGFLGF